MAAEASGALDGLLDAAWGLRSLRAAGGETVAVSQPAEQALSDGVAPMQADSPVFTEGAKRPMLERIARLREGAAGRGDIDSADSLHALLPAVTRPTTRLQMRGGSLRKKCELSAHFL